MNGGRGAVSLGGKYSFPEVAMSEACRAPTKRSEDGGAVFAVKVKAFWLILVSRYKRTTEPQICHDAEALWRAVVGVRVQ